MFKYASLSANAISKAQRAVMTLGALILTVLLTIVHKAFLSISFTLALFAVNVTLVRAQEHKTAAELHEKEKLIRVLKESTGRTEKRLSDLEKLARSSRKPKAKMHAPTGTSSDTTDYADIYRC